MAAAITAARRGHAVTLCEKSPQLGGALGIMQGVYIKRQILRFLALLENEMYKLPVKVRLETEVNETVIKEEKPDVLFAAVGSEPALPPIPGTGEPYVVQGARLNASGVSGQKVVVIGGGLVGCELAVELLQNGNTVTLLEMTDVLAAEAPHFHRVAMLECMKALEGVHTGMRVREIRDNAVYAENRDGETATFPADLAVLACGLRPNKALEAYRTLVPRYIPIGDCLHPAKIGDAVRQAVDMVIDMDTCTG